MINHEPNGGGRRSDRQLGLVNRTRHPHPNGGEMSSDQRGSETGLAQRAEDLKQITPVEPEPCEGAKQSALTQRGQIE